MASAAEVGLASHMKHLSTRDLSGTPPPNEQKTGAPVQKISRKILALPGFDNVMGAIILLNMIVMIVEIDMSTEEEEPQDLHWTAVFGWMVLVVFVLELMLRLAALRCAFWRDPWNIIDFLIVVTDVIFSVIGLVAENLFPVSTLRIFRLSKLMRVSKVLRAFPELRMMLVGLLTSLRAIFWGALLLLLFLLVWSMVAVMLIHPLNKDIEYPGCERCHRAYSSVMQAALTFWQITVAGDSWGTFTIPLIEEHPSTAFFFIPAFLCMALSVMNLMLAVVVNLATKAYENEEAETEAGKALKHMKKEGDMLRLCAELDSDHDGELSHDELYNGFTCEGEFRDDIMDMGFTEDDFDIIWKLTDLDKSGSVSYKEFITFLFTMKSSETTFMITYIKHYVTWIKDAIIKQVEVQNLEELNMDKKLQQTLDAVKIEEQAILTEEYRIEDYMTSAPPRKEITEEDRSEDYMASAPSCKATDTDGGVVRQHEACADFETGEGKPSKGTGILAGSGHPVVRDEIQELAQQVSKCVERMHLELKDILTVQKGTVQIQTNTASLKKESGLRTTACI